MRKKVRVCLFAGRERPVSLGIGHSAHHHYIAVLDMDQILLKSLEVVCLIFLIDIITRHVSGI